MTLVIEFKDIIRATLETECGNEGYIGLSPDGQRYHVVVPVDRQIARGLKAGNPPLDETPFGGYKDWPYFCCLGYSRPIRYDETDIRKVRMKQARVNAILLKSWTEQINIPVEVKNIPTLIDEKS
ncbi:MAG: hypothetical protein C0407_00460 [Desulfobacca sp.]|nr:hypothetical protein [Desulfobacca sp.]